MTDEMLIPTCCSQDFGLIFSGEYAIPMSEQPKSVLDIGANVGLFSVWAAREWPDAKITSYEPWPENVEMLRKNAAEYPQISIVPVAVRGSTGRARMLDNGYSPIHSFHIRNPGLTGEREVDVMDASDLVSAEFVKIDTEGCEVEIIERLDLSATKYIALEAHSRTDANRLLTFLCARGYALHNCYPAGDGCLLMKFIRRTEINAKAKKLFIAVPTYSGSHAQFWQCLMRVQENPPCEIQVRNIDGDSLVSRARNTLTAEFLNSDCSHMLFIDSDLIFSGDQIKRLMDHDADVVAGFYPKKQDGNLQWVCNALANRKPDDSGLQEVRYMGTGFIRVSRNALVQMITAYGDKCWYHPDHSPQRTEYDLWPVGVYQYPDGNRRYLSEDWYFCQRWLDLGGKVFGDTKIVLKHIGQAVYPLLSQRPQISNPIEPSNKSDTSLT